jgi:hypothetical protein
MKIQVIKHNKKEVIYIPVAKFGEISLILNVKKNGIEPLSSEIVEMTEKELKKKQNA